MNGTRIRRLWPFHTTTPARLLVVLLLLVTSSVSPTSAQSAGPGIDDLLNLKRVGNPVVSPDGRSVAYTLRETNWDDNDFETEIWLGTTTETRQLTNAAKSSMQPAWSPDGRWLAFVSDRNGRRQLYRLNVGGGEAERLTSGDEGVNGFAWAPDGSRIVYTMTDAVAESVKEREKKFGDIRIEDEDRRMAHLHLLTLPAAAGGSISSKPLTSGAFVVGSFDWSPDGRSIVFDHRVSSDPADGDSADISIVDVASSTRRTLVTQAGPDSNPRWSPDGTRIAFVSSMAKPFFYYQNSVIAVTPVTGGSVEALTDRFDEDPGLIRWTTTGIFFSASQRTWAYLFQLDPATKQIARHAVADSWIGNGFSLTPDGRAVAFVGSGPASFPDVYLGSLENQAGLKPGPAALKATAVSKTGEQIAAWPKHTREVVKLEEPGRRRDRRCAPQAGRLPERAALSAASSSFTAVRPASRDRCRTRTASATTRSICGSRKARSCSSPTTAAAPATARRSARSTSATSASAMRGTSCRGSITLVAAGLVDRDRVGAMGWSQGGYISAFLTTKHADRFKAVSVGAGISNWMTYYVNTDIHPFTRQYLKATPWDDPEDLRRHVADDLHQERQGADADPARRSGSAGAAAECLRAVPGPARSERADAARAVQGLRPSAQQAESQSRRDAAEPRLVQQVPVAEYWYGAMNAILS